jgi:hypothetical protein
LPGVETNITPRLTSGGASWPFVAPVANTHTGCRRLAFCGVIWSSGL